ncbi:DUF2812 domain-containing protein [Anaerobacillus alkaliphilus]|uniref:DUF2812 domain-containing protein n=1 Tax=Anaerobacillus alkaliphilus TaxID=1548597 RepID=A0A4Q0VXP9_9BACI|nr:DUF2812 domain-containing protein [Anaerobacillus alkaliphilus]RXJ04464.1 DUF2812 domain-containing protein [Anaerobacillus alkaliphilus]
MKKMMLFDTWNLERLGSLFSYMGEQGWHLTEVKGGQAIFEKGNVTKTRYRIDTFPINDLKGQNKLDANEQLGWQYIDSIGSIHIFREKEYVEAKEIYTDGSEHARSLKIIQRSHLLKTLGATFLLALSSWLYLNILKNNFTVVLLYDSVIVTLISIFVLGYFLLKMYIGVFYLANLRKKLEDGYQTRIGRITKMKLYQMKVRKALLFLLAAAMTIMGLLELSNSNPYIMFQDDELKIVMLGEILEGENYENVRNGKWRELSFREDGSFFVPNQISVRQSVEIGKDPVYNPTIWAKRYEVGFESIAKLLVLIMVQEKQHLGTFERKTNPSIDELWTIEEENFTSFIARVGKNVFIVDYWGIETVDTLIQYSIKN